MTKFFWLALLFGDHDRLTHGLTPTAGPPIKRLTRRLERASRAATRRAASRRAADVVGGPAAASASATAETARVRWFAQRRAYRQLRHQKSVLFWSNKLTTATGPRDMVNSGSIARLWWGGRACDRVSANELSIFFANKVKHPIDYFRCTTADVSS